MLSIKICLSLSRFLFLFTKEGTFFCFISNPSSSFHFKAFNVCDSSSPRRVLLSDSWVPWQSSEQTCVLAEGLSISLHSRHYLTLSLQSEHRSQEVVMLTGGNITSVRHTEHSWSPSFLGMDLRK